MEKKYVIEKVYKMITEENLNLYRDMFDNTDTSKVTDPYWKDSLRLYKALSNENKEIFFKVIKQIGIDTVSNIFALLDGVTSLDGQNDDFILAFKKTNEKINGDLQDLFLEFDEYNR